MKTKSTIIKPGRFFRINTLALAFLFALPLLTVKAANISWIGLTADYTNAVDWDSNAVPGSADNAINDNSTNNVVQINVGDPDWTVTDIRAGNAVGDGAYVQNGQTVKLNGWFRMGVTAPNTGIYTLNSGTINYQANHFSVGEFGTGILNMNGGAINGSGNFAINLGGVNDGNINPLNSNTAIFTQSNGAVTITGGGQLFIGNQGTGIYNLSGGSIDCHNYMAVGRSGGNGTLNMTGGNFNQDGGGNILVGTGFQNNGHTCVGVLNQSGGTITDQSQFLCPENSPASGTYNLSGTGALIVDSWLVIGRGGASGVMNMSGGTLTGNTSGGGNFEIGEGIPGTVNQSGGAITMNMQTWLGQGSGAVSTFNMSGGTYKANNWFAIGRNGGNGTLNLTNGIISTSGVGNFGVGSGTGAIGTLNQYGGSITNTASATFIGDSNAKGTWNLFGGNASLALLQIINTGTTASTLSLNGGVMSVQELTSGNPSGGVSSLNLNGGTLQATANNTTFLHDISIVNLSSTGGAVFDSQIYNITVSEPLPNNGDGSGGLTKIGTGTLTLTGANGYSGDTTINGGKLITGTGSSAAGNYTAADNAGFGILVQSGGAQFNANNVTLGSSIGASLDFNMGAFGNPGLSSAPLNVNGNFSINGTITVNIADALPQVGEFPLVHYSSTPSGSAHFVIGSLPVGVVANLVTNVGNSSIDLNISTVNLPRWDGQAGGTWDIGLTTNWVNIGTGQPTTYGEGNVVLFDDNAAGTTSVNVTTTVNPGGVTLNNSSLNYTFTGSGKISGSTGINKGGAGTLTIVNTGGNNYTGPTVVTTGTLNVTNLANGGLPSAIGASSANPTNLVLVSGTFAYSGSPVSVNRGYSIQNTNNTIDTEGNLTLSGAVAAATVSDFLKTGPAQLTYAMVGSNVLSGSSSLGYRTIQGTTKFDGSTGGQTNIIQGHFGVGGLGGVNATVILTNTTLNVTLGGIDLGRSGGATGTLSVNTGAVLNTTAGNFALGDGGGIASTGVVNQSGGTINVTGPQIFVGQNIAGFGSYNLSGGTLNINNWLAVGRQGGAGVFNLSGTGVLNKTGSGNLDIGTSAGVNGFAGSGTVNQTGGIITNSASDTWLAEGVSGQNVTGVWNMSGGSAWLGSVKIGYAGIGSGTVNLSGSATVIGNGFVSLGFNSGVSGFLNIGNAGSPGGTWTMNGGFDFNVGDAGGTTNVLTMVANGGGQLIIPGNLYLTRGNASATVNLNGGTITAGFVNNGFGFSNNLTNNTQVFNFNGGTLKAFQNASPFVWQFVNTVVQSGGAVIDDGGFTVGVNSILANGGGGGGLTKLGSGTLYLNGVNTYTGITLVSAGSLGGSGTIAGPVTVAAGGTLVAGSGSIGIFTINNTLTFAAGSTNLMKLAAANNDHVVGLTSVTYNGTLVVTNTSGAPLTVGSSFQLFNSAVAGSGNFSSVTILPAGAGTFNPSTGILTITSAGGGLTFNPVQVSGGNLVLTGMGGAPGAGYTLLTTTNLTTPLTSWTTNTTGNLNGTGAFSNNIPVNVSAPAQFFIIRTP